MIKVNENEFKKACEEAPSMAEAASALGLHFNTFKKYAVKFGCYKPNQSGKGLPKKQPGFDLAEILEGKHPQYQTYKLKKRLLKEKVFENVCSMCGISDWNGQELGMELDHIDGNRCNHRLDNLRILCPNCHAQTGTYRARNKSLNREIY